MADRICRFVNAVGDRERAIAGCDCGFSTFAGWAMVPADVAWKKMQMLTDGACRGKRSPLVNTRRSNRAG